MDDGDDGDDDDDDDGCLLLADGCWLLASDINRTVPHRTVPHRVSSSLLCQNGAVATAPTLCSAMCRRAKSTLHGIRFGSWNLGFGSCVPMAGK
jgi:hypothetical protein